MATTKPVVLFSFLTILIIIVFGCTSSDDTVGKLDKNLAEANQKILQLTRDALFDKALISRTKHPAFSLV